MDATNNIATDLFYKIRSRFSGLKLGDETSQITINPEDARFFDFNYTEGENPIGHITVSLAEPNSMKVYFSTGITEGMDDGQKNNWYKFLKELRQFAKRRLLAFDTRDIAKDNLDRRDFAFLSQYANPKPTTPDSVTTPVGEGIMNESNLYGTRKQSFQKLEDTRLVIKHSKQVMDDAAPGARTRNISALFVENQEGERFKYPFIHLAGARAMQRHVANGGVPYDDIGSSLIKMSEEIAQLKSFKNYVVRNDLMNSDNNLVVERSTSQLEALKTQVAKLAKQRHYEAFVENFQAVEQPEVPEEMMEQFKDQFTVKSFKEDITSVFPVLYRLMQEKNEVGYDDIVEMTNEEVNEEVEEQVEKSVDPFAQFEEWAMTLGEQSAIQSNDDEEKQNAVKELQELVGQDFPAGVDGTNAIQSLEGIIDDPKLQQQIKELAKEDSSQDARSLVKDWLDENAPDVVEELDFGDFEETAPEVGADEVEPQEEDIEFTDEGNAFADELRKAREAGEDEFEVDGKTYKVENFINEGQNVDEDEVRNFLRAFDDVANDMRVSGDVNPETVIRHLEQGDVESAIEAVTYQYAGPDGEEPGKGFDDLVDELEADFRYIVDGPEDDDFDLRQEYDDDPMDDMMDDANELNRIANLAGIEESGLQRYTGIKKYGKKGFEELQKAGREGASEEEKGAIKDKYLKKKDEDIEVDEDNFDKNFEKRIAATVKGGAGAEYMKKKADQYKQQNKELDPGAAEKGLGIGVLDAKKAYDKAKKKGAKFPSKGVTTSPNTRDPGRLPEGEKDLPFEPDEKTTDKDEFGNTIKKKNKAKHLAKKGMKSAMDKEKISEVAEFIFSCYDKDRGTFPKGPEGVTLMVGKKFGEDAEVIARKMVERMAPQQDADIVSEDDLDEATRREFMDLLAKAGIGTAAAGIGGGIGLMRAPGLADKMSGGATSQDDEPDTDAKPEQYPDPEFVEVIVNAVNKRGYDSTIAALKNMPMFKDDPKKLQDYKDAVDKELGKDKSVDDLKRLAGLRQKGTSG